MKKSSLKLLVGVLLLFTAIGLGIFYRDSLSIEALSSHYSAIQAAIQNNFYLTLFVFFLVYTLAVALSFPGALVLTLTGGLLFGTFVGGVTILLAATLGATLLFIAARFFFKEAFSKKLEGKLAAFKQGFEKDAFNYLLFLRLTPLFPFWLVNLAPAFLNVSLKTFVTASFLGMAPATFIFASIGNGLGSLAALKDGLKVTPSLLIALTGLGLLALLPLLVKRFFKGQQDV